MLLAVRHVTADAKRQAFNSFRMACQAWSRHPTTLTILLQSDMPPESSVACELGTNAEGRSEAAFSRSSAQSGVDSNDAAATDHWSMQVGAVVYIVCRFARLCEMDTYQKSCNANKTCGWIAPCVHGTTERRDCGERAKP